MFVDIVGRLCVVVGGGKVAERKARSLMASGAHVTVISPRRTQGIESDAVKGRLTLVKRGYKKGDAIGAFLVIAATDSEETNQAIAKDARRGRAMVNVVDDPVLCDFIAPSVVERGPLTLAISSSGACPALVKKLRKDMEKIIGKEYAIFTDMLAKVRDDLLKNRVGRAKKERIIKALINSPAVEWIKAGQVNRLERYVDALVNKDSSASSSLRKRK
ncbi:MAG: bifunctional precorrin-2 dehydrogenase/sirohydrochlorin ferrochelatase [Deltaproteobacteria bacterium]|nr:bifunctional precorrin-2 dehydrogenase/sirohydrochlorin ferrochelatase [Deltaproteobacteria bacterium]